MGTRDQIFPRLIGGFLLALALLTGAPAAYAQSASADGDAVVVSPLSLVKVDDLYFGDVISSPVPGTITVSPGGARTVTGGVTAAGGFIQNAEFRGYGTRNRFVYLYSSPGVYTLNRLGGGATLTLRSLTVQADNLTPQGFPGLFRINSTDVIILKIGGTVDVAANQQEGAYEGTFPITLNYF